VPPALPFRFDAATISAGPNFTLTTSFGSIDALGEIAGVGDFDNVLKRSTPEIVFGLTIMTLSLDRLIAAKRAAGRVKDKLHLLELEELRKLCAPGSE
jgi:hypothetical protein